MNKFLVSINGEPVQALEVKTGLYKLAVVAALALLPHRENVELKIVKIWCPELFPEYGPYFYTLDDSLIRVADDHEINMFSWPEERWPEELHEKFSVITKRDYAAEIKTNLDLARELVAVSIIELANSLTTSTTIDQPAIRKLFVDFKKEMMEL